MTLKLEPPLFLCTNNLHAERFRLAEDVKYHHCFIDFTLTACQSIKGVFIHTKVSSFRFSISTTGSEFFIASELSSWSDMVIEDRMGVSVMRVTDVIK